MSEWTRCDTIANTYSITVHFLIGCIHTTLINGSTKVGYTSDKSVSNEGTSLKLMVFTLCPSESTTRLPHPKDYIDKATHLELVFVNKWITRIVLLILGFYEQLTK